MTITKFMPLDELLIRRMTIQSRVDLVENRLRNPPPFACWNKRIDLALAADLHKYLDDLNEEIASRTPSP